MAKAPAVVNTGTDVAAAVPDFMKGQVGAATNIESTDIQIPRLKLIQSTSKEVDDGIKPGSFYHDIQEIVIEQPLDFVPVYHWKSYMLWRPLDNGGGILARAPDGKTWDAEPGTKFDVKVNKNTTAVTWEVKDTDVKKSGLADWGSEDPANKQSPPAAVLMYNVVCYLPKHPELGLVVLTFQRGTLKVGKRFVTKLAMAPVPSFGQLYTLGSEKIPNSNNQEFWSYTVAGAGFIKDEALFKNLQEQNENLSKNAINVLGEDDIQTEAAATGGEAGGTDEKMAGRI